MRFLPKYQKKLERRFRLRVERKGFNFPCDIGLSNKVRLAAAALECPIYPLMEEIIERGLSEIAEILRDVALKEQPQRHLVRDHLLVDRLDQEAETVSRRAIRLSNAMRFLELYEYGGLTPEDIKRALDMVEAETREGRLEGSPDKERDG